jgi:hypothetical protein
MMKLIIFGRCHIAQHQVNLKEKLCSQREALHTLMKDLHYCERLLHELL